jgi:hypothetical protein
MIASTPFGLGRTGYFLFFSPIKIAAEVVAKGGSYCKLAAILDIKVRNYQ